MAKLVEWNPDQPRDELAGMANTFVLAIAWRVAELNESGGSTSLN